ncbi:MAG TPA: four helix bundle protein [Chloroflexaceae bacterium]|nr:four helix bundle protein [Chloroflexaceae bacterium]
MNYREWEAASQGLFYADPIWQVEAYRLALFLADICWHDTSRLHRDRRTLGVAEQLYAAVGSIGANIAEGYGREPGKDRARFYSYALGSARESQAWYFSARHVLGEEVQRHRHDVLTSIIRLLTVMATQQRGRRLQDEGELYSPDPQSHARGDQRPPGMALDREVPFFNTEREG